MSQSNDRKTNVRLVVAALSLVIGSATFVLILKLAFQYSTVLPFWDAWEFIDQLARQAGHYSFANLWAQHNEHRIFIPKLFFLVDVFFFKATGHFLLICIIITQLLTVLVLCASIRSRDDVSGSARISLFGLMLFLFFLPVQMDNLVWGFQLQFVLVIFFAVLSFYSFSKLTPPAASNNQQRPQSLLFSLGLSSALCATLCMASGLFVWPFLALISVARRLGRNRLLITLACWFLITAAYLHGYVTPNKHSDPLESLSKPFLILQYLALYVGGSWIVYGETVASIVGFTGIAAGIVFLLIAGWHHKKLSGSDIFFLSVILFVFVTAIITGLGRIRFGIAQGFSSRYQTVSLLFWGALSVLAVSWLGSRFGRRSLSPLIMLLGFLLLLWSPLFRLKSILEPFALRADQWKLEEIAVLTGVGDVQMDETVIENPDLLPSPITFLRERNLSVFSEKYFHQLGAPIARSYLLDSTSACLGDVESYAARGAQGYSGSKLMGWAVDHERRSSFHDLLVVDADGKISGLAIGGYADPNPTAIRGRQPKTRDGWVGYKRATEDGNGFRLFGIMPDGKHVCAIGHQLFTAQSLKGYDSKASKLMIALSKTKNGVFRDGQWWRDNLHGSTGKVESPEVPIFGQKGDIPVVGDWDGSGNLRIGIFRDGQWWLDMNGDYKWQAGVDRVLIFGQKGDIPVTGDWDGTGRLRIGIFRNGEWWLDMNGDFKWQTGDKVVVLGQKGDYPVVGDWDGTGRLRIGIFRNGEWWLDIDGDLKWQAGVDQMIHFGGPGDLPVVGNWDAVGKLRIGTFRDGHWRLDVNGNNHWDGPTVDREFIFGQKGDAPSLLQWPELSR